jgi:uncharacterized protein
MTTVTVRQLWRFPVKSMGGTPVDEVRIDRRGVHADRLWAVRDLDNDITATGRRLPALLKCTARYVTEPGDDAGPGNVPAVVIDFPDGSAGCSTDTDIDERLSEVAGRRVRLTPLPRESDTSVQRLRLRQTLAAYAPSEIRRDFGLADTDKLPDSSIFSVKEVATLARFSTPPGTFVDLSPVHLLSTTSMTSLSADGEGFDARRFRPNVLVDITHAATDFPEAGWAGARLHIGDATLRVSGPTIRCVIPTRPQPGIDLDRSITRLLAERTDRFLGVYADVARPGTVWVGDVVHVHLPQPPSALHRAGGAAGRQAQRRLQWLLEATVLRGR